MYDITFFYFLLSWNRIFFTMRLWFHKIWILASIHKGFYLIRKISWMWIDMLMRYKIIFKQCFLNSLIILLIFIFFLLLNTCIMFALAFFFVNTISVNNPIVIIVLVLFFYFNLFFFIFCSLTIKLKNIFSLCILFYLSTWNDNMIVSLLCRWIAIIMLICALIVIINGRSCLYNFFDFFFYSLYGLVL